MESRTQGSRRRPMTALPRTDPLEAKDRNARGQGQGLRTQAQVLPPKKVFTKIFQTFHKLFSFHNSRNSAVLGDRAIFEDLRLRGQGLDLRGLGPGHQNVSSSTPPLILRAINFSSTYQNVNDLYRKALNY